MPTKSISKEVSEQQIQAKLNQQAKQKAMVEAVLPFAGLVAIILFFTVATHGSFLSLSNLQNLLNQGFIYTLCSAGAAMIYTLGCLDLSVGVISAIAQLCAALLMRNAGLPAWAGLIVCILVVVFCQSITAVVSATLRVPVFVCSVCMLNIGNGIMQYACESANVTIDFTQYAFWNQVWVKLLFLILTIAGVVFVYYYTRLGKDLKALGENPTVAFQSGVSKLKTTWLAFLVMAVCVGVASFFTIIRSGEVSPATNSTLGINILTAMILGGFPITGGTRSSIVAPIIGALTVVALTNGLTLMGFDLGLRVMVKGLLFLIVIVLSGNKSNGIFVR